MTKIISFTGAQGTGKTTMRLKLKHYLEKQGHTVLGNYIGVTDSVARDAANEGFPINEEVNMDSQYYIALRYFSADIRTREFCKTNPIDYVVLDRSIIDSLAYTERCFGNASGFFHGIESMVTSHFNWYPTDYLIQCRPVDVLVKDEHRSTDKFYQMSIDEKINNLCQTYTSGTGCKFIELKNNSPEDRLKYMLSEIEGI